jgi:polyphosphate kinase
VEIEQAQPVGPGAERSVAAADSLARAPDRYLNRELSWLDFNERVLLLARRQSLPLLERTKFLAIFSNNLDEFFQVRIGGLKMQQQAEHALGRVEQRGGVKLEAISERVRQLLAEAETIYADQSRELAAADIHLVDWDDLAADDQAYCNGYFDEHILPVLTPLAVDPAHPFPYISNLSLNLAVVVRAPGELTRRTARVKVPPLLPRFVGSPGGTYFVPLEQLIARRLSDLFPGMEILESSAFRVTRNTDYDVDLDGVEDLVSAVETVLTRRRRSRTVVRLEVDAGMSDETLALLVRELRLVPEDVYRSHVPLNLAGLWSIVSLDRPDLKLAPWTPVTQSRLVSNDSRAIDMFAVIRQGDVLVQHPYDSFETSVEEFIERAACDPDVVAIKQTLYRTSAAESPILEALIQAAGEGKQVVCVVELKARFDEQTNIDWAQRLEDAGVHVSYGVVGLKTHAKLCLVVREDHDRLYRYVHIGTGNYNPDTARLYEDIGLFTADPDLTADVSDLFNLLTGYSRQSDFRRLLVAPSSMRRDLLELIRSQTKSEGQIVMKLNSLVDPELIDALYDASAAGASVDLIVRGICCLRPGVQGLSETIRVRSIVGRYLEHSRIYRFGTGGEATYLIGSADLMQRNLDRRVETLAPIDSPELRVRLDEILDALLADDTLAWKLGPEGQWERVQGTSGVNAQIQMEQLAAARARRLAAV